MARYANPRSLQSRLDLADLSVRVQSIPVCAIADILPDQIADAQRMTLRRVAENVATAAEQFSTGAGYSRTTRSWRTRYLIMITLCVLFIDVAYAAQFALDWVSKTLQLVGSNVFVIALGLLCPVLLYQARTFQLHTKMIPLARRVTLAHASLTLAQSVYALFVPIEEAALGATASPRYGEGGADLTPLQRAAAFFAAFCIPAPLVITKLLYIATVVLVIGSPFSLRKVRYDKLGHLE
ncbi:Vesicle-trafficking protein S22a [Polyrhizophydium stewartii]|uniref:Vesicle-trafficking protein S22a n=1 Tax=Polyrhizophydium stewartii TaxID=2732419 RepID=A0ABR4ND71_9FUNG